jgi:hypothetical protein
MAMLIVEGVELPTPSSFSWGLNDVSDEDSGRTTDDLMHKNRTSQKRKIQLEWWGIGLDTASTILIAVNPEYIHVTYNDVMDNATETREFYVGDRSAPLQQFTLGNKLLNKLAFDIVER